MKKINFVFVLSQYTQYYYDSKGLIVNFIKSTLLFYYKHSLSKFVKRIMKLPRPHSCKLQQWVWMSLVSLLCIQKNISKKSNAFKSFQKYLPHFKLLSIFLLQGIGLDVYCSCNNNQTDRLKQHTEFLNIKYLIIHDIYVYQHHIYL